MKKKYYLYLFLALLVLFIAYNYYSAAQAEEDISRFITEQIDAPNESISVQYSNINVSPFRGNIVFEDVNIIQPQTIRRARELKLDLNYFDFLKFSIGGTEYGLKHLSEVLLIFENVSFKNRRTRAEVLFRELSVNYSGNVWEGFLTTGSLTEKITIVGKNAEYQKPNSSIGTFKADSLTINHTFIAKVNPAKNPVNSFLLNDITWNPPQSFKQNYAFFLNGLDIEADSILIDRLRFNYMLDEREIEISEGKFKTNLLDAGFYGTIDKMPHPVFSPLYITVTALSDQLSNVLKNLKQLFNLQIPVSEGAQFKLAGPVTDPRIILDEQINE